MQANATDVVAALQHHLSVHSELPPWALQWAVGPGSRNPPPRPPRQDPLDFHASGRRFPSVLYPGHDDESDSTSGQSDSDDEQYLGAWGGIDPPATVAPEKEETSSAAGDASSASKSMDVEAKDEGSKETPRWLVGPGKERIDHIMNLIVLPVESLEAADHVYPVASGSVTLEDTANNLGLLAARAAVGVRGVEGDKDLPRGATPDHLSLTLTQTLIRNSGEGNLLVRRAPREIFASVLRVFSPYARGSFHHACAVIQKLLHACPDEVARALSELGPQPLKRIMAFLHHAPVADMLVQLVTMTHNASSQGGAGNGVGGGGGMMGTMFGGPPRDDELGALFSKTGTDLSPMVRSQWHSRLSMWKVIPELCLHITTYGVLGSGWGPRGLFPAPGSEPSEETERAAEDAVRAGDEMDDALASLIADTSKVVRLAAAEAAHVTAASDALVEIVRVLRQQGPTVEPALKLIGTDMQVINGLIEASCGQTLQLHGRPALDIFQECTGTPLSAFQTTGASPRSLAAIRCLVSLTELAYEQNLPNEGPLAGLPTGAPRVLRRSPMSITTEYLTLHLIYGIPRLAAHLAVLSEALHPGKSEEVLRLKARSKKKHRGHKSVDPDEPKAGSAGDNALRSLHVPVCGAVSHPGHHVDVPFGQYRLEAIKLISMVVNKTPTAMLDHLSGEGAAHASSKFGSTLSAVAKMRAEAASTTEELHMSFEPPSSLGGWEGPGFWGALTCWAVFYPHCDLYHRSFERLVQIAILQDHKPTLQRLVVGCRLITLMMDLALGKEVAVLTTSSGAKIYRSGAPPSPARAVALRVLAMFRLSLQSRPLHGDWLRDLIRTNPVWSERIEDLEGVLRSQRSDTLPRPPRTTGLEQADGRLPPAVAAMIARIQGIREPDAQELALERAERESIDLGGNLAKELGFEKVARKDADDGPAAVPSSAASIVTEGDETDDSHAAASSVDSSPATGSQPNNKKKKKKNKSKGKKAANPPPPPSPTTTNDGASSPSRAAVPPPPLPSAAELEEESAITASEEGRFKPVKENLPPSEMDLVD
jgi:hypothetical protein